ncbi:paired box protein Pax-5-like [Saccoglossus kowalevskii]
MLRSKQGFLTPPVIREKIVELYLEGISFADIAKRVGVTKSTAYNICKNFTSTSDTEHDTGGPQQCPKLNDNVLQHIELYNNTKPSIYLRQIRRNVIAENVCTIDTVPCLSTIHCAITKYLEMS